MTPFREKPLKWDGNTDDGRYENKGGYKFDVITQTVLKKSEDMPACFLADTPIEAENIYKQFEKILNHFAYSYSISTGISKADLFGEALIGLARAYRDWNPDRSDNFEVYARFVIRDTLNEFVRSNSAIISVPSYIKKANSNLKRVKAVCEEHNVDWRTFVIEREVPNEMNMENALKCSKLIGNLISAAERAGVDYAKFVERVELVPEDMEYIDQTPPEIHKRDSETLEAAIIVEKLKEHMTEQELLICEGIMLDKSFDEIGADLGKSKSWVSGKLKALKKRIISMMEDGTL